MRTYKCAYIEISNICNLQCSFCPPVERAKKNMSVDLFSNIIAEIAPYTEEVSLHLMGEPLNHPHFAEFVHACEKWSMPVNLTTNGLLLTAERRELALSPVIRQVNISVHSFEANFGTKDVTGYLQRVFRFTRDALERRPDLYINYRIWDMRDPVTLSETNAEIRRQISEEFGVEFESIDLRRRKGHRLIGRVYLNFDSRFIWPNVTLPKISERGFCHGLSSHFGVHADGTVVPCCLDKEAVLNLGNCQETPIGDILSGHRAESMRQGFARGELVEDLCTKCTFVTRFRRKADVLAAQAKSAK